MYLCLLQLTLKLIPLATEVILTFPETDSVEQRTGSRKPLMRFHGKGDLAQKRNLYIFLNKVFNFKSSLHFQLLKRRCLYFRADES